MTRRFLARRGRAWPAVAFVALFPSIAAAQGADTHHPVIPGAGIAAEGGPGTMWVNPANLAYDPDPRVGVFGTGSLDGVQSLAATAGFRGFGIGLHDVLRDTPEGTRSDFSIDYGTSFRLPKRLSLGVLLSWNLLEDERNYLGYDLGAAWRPLPWLGLGAVAQNVGNPDHSGYARPRSAAGLALRPFGPLLVLGAEYARLFANDFATSGTGAPLDDEDRLVGSLRLRPAEGLYVRGGMDWPLAEGPRDATFTVGLELYFDGLGFGGAGARAADGTIAQTWFVGTDDPGESLIRAGRRVPSLELERTPPYQPGGGPLGGKSASWLDTLELVRRAEDDRGVHGLVLTLGGASLSFARAYELRERILSLESEGKPVLVYLTGSPSTVDFYVASAAKRVALHPATDLQLVGLSVELTHFRGLLDLVGVEPQYVKRSDYKTSPESYTEVAPTPANLEMTEALLDDLYGELVDGMSAGRHAEADVVRGWIDGGPHSAEDALSLGIVDVLLYPDQLDGELAKLHGHRVSTPELLDQEQPHSAWEDPKQIAVVYVEGGITSGESSRGGLLSGRTAGAKSVVRNLERAAGDPQVRAIVLRVDSPGGSSFASDEIWRTIDRIHEQTEKPVVVSMGGVAASGGYYVAAGADAIWAEPTTITGSIGVYSGKFSLEAAQERLGVTTTLLGRGANSGAQSSSRPWDDVQRAKMQSLVDETYRQFKDRVARGREMTPEDVEEVARGRVWSGARAQDLGLVDAIGGFQDAIADARERAGIPERRKIGLVTYSDSGGLVQSLAPSLATSVRWVLQEVGARPTIALPGDVGRLLDLAAPADSLVLPLLHPEERVWALEPFELNIRAGGGPEPAP